MPITTSPQSGSGGSTPGLPVWTFSASDDSAPDAGKFTTDSAALSTTSAINLSTSAKDGSGDWASNPPFSSPEFWGTDAAIQLVNSSGIVAVFSVVSQPSIAGSVIELSVSKTILSGSPNWSGDYQLILYPVTPPPALPNIIDVLNGSGISPIVDGTYPISGSLGGSISTMSGVITAISTAT